MREDFLIVGAGITGLTIAERLTSIGKTVTIVDKELYIGGNCADRFNEHGILIHPFGPHLFHTNSKKVFRYLSQFTDWIPGDYRVKSFNGGKHWSFPINLETFEMQYGKLTTPEVMAGWLKAQTPNYGTPNNFVEAVVGKIGWGWYKQFYEGYTTKMWGCHPEDLDASVGRRIPVRTNRDDRYFDDEYQFMPKQGYSTMFENMLGYKDNLKVLLGMDREEWRQMMKLAKHTIFTGAIDEYFNYAWGALPYRTLRFEHETFPTDLVQPTGIVTYPEFSTSRTRSVEIKHFTKQAHPSTTVVTEYPEEWAHGRERLYPVPTPTARERHGKYARMARDHKNVTFLGRLGTYRYLNMDQAVGAALMTFDRMF
jgi:UDP-galactopyranose mutase